MPDRRRATNGATPGRGSRRTAVRAAGAEARVLARGSPMPFGATVVPDGLNVAIFSRHATRVSLAVFAPGGRDPERLLPLDPRYNRTGDVWHALLPGAGPGVEYGFVMDGPHDAAYPIHRFDPSVVLIDPFAHVLGGGATWGRTARRRVLVPQEAEFDWELDQPLNTPLADSIIYELHVRGYTRDPSSGAAAPGTYLGLTEMIPYLKELGITAVELLPVCEFDECENTRVNPFTGERLLNFWGYSSIAFFAPKASYASGPPAVEFREMVKRFHAAGIEVILDMVFNHTAEGDQRGPTLSFRGIDNVTYYILDPQTGAYRDFTGCGNTLNCNHPVVRDLILNCLRYWVVEMHVDGFRFDLASVLGRGQDGTVLSNPPLLEHLAADPILANTKLIAEAWDAAGLYQVGSFPAWGRWAEWNGKFRDEVRRFVRGDPGTVPALATRLSGSADLYAPSGRQPSHSINFVTCHDGFTLRDLVSYDTKHNLENGEDNRDGASENFSWNCGVEGETDDPEVRALRLRQMKNLAALLFVAHGVPMMLGGDELGRTQRGNNNAYAQDNPTAWMDWRLTPEAGELLRFFRHLTALRRTEPAMRRRSFDPGGQWIEWHGVRLGEPDWSYESHSLAMFLRALRGTPGHHVYVIANAYWEPLRFELPRYRWRRAVDTSRACPEDICMPGVFERLDDPRSYEAGPRSVVVLIAPK